MCWVRSSKPMVAFMLNRGFVIPDYVVLSFKMTPRACCMTCQVISALPSIIAVYSVGSCVSWWCTHASLLMAVDAKNRLWQYVEQNGLIRQNGKAVCDHASFNGFFYLYAVNSKTWYHVRLSWTQRSPSACTALSRRQ